MESAAILSHLLENHYPVPLRPYQMTAVRGLTRTTVEATLAGDTIEKAVDILASPRGGIVHLRTGAGKTNIASAVGFVEIFFPHWLSISDSGYRSAARRLTKTVALPRDIVMLTPTRVLTQQQAAVFKAQMEHPKVRALAELCNICIEVQVATAGAVSTVGIVNPNGPRNGSKAAAAANGAKIVGISALERKLQETGDAAFPGGVDVDLSSDDEEGGNAGGGRKGASAPAMRHVRILVSTPGTYMELVKSQLGTVLGGRATSAAANATANGRFPLPGSCSTIFFDEVHHCASKHPYALVADYIQRTYYQVYAINGGSNHHGTKPLPPRMIGLTATLTYARDTSAIEGGIRSLYSMINAPLAERYAATDEELKECGVPEPPSCKVLDFYEDSDADSDDDSAAINAGGAASAALNSPLHYPKLLVKNADVNAMMAVFESGFNSVKESSLNKPWPAIADAKKPKDPPYMPLMDGKCHLYSRYMFLMMRKYERLTGLQRNGGYSLIGGKIKLRDLVSEVIDKLHLRRHRFITADPRQLSGMLVNGNLSPADLRNVKRTDKEVQGELMCILYQSMRLVIASKQRDLEIAVRYLHRSRPVFERLGEEAFLDNNIPLVNPLTKQIAFSDCERVVEALKGFVAVAKNSSPNAPNPPQAAAKGKATANRNIDNDFRTIIFCESSLSVAVLAEYITECFVDDDNDKPDADATPKDALYNGRELLWRGGDYLFRSDWLASTGNDPAFNIPHRSQSEQENVVASFREGLFNVMCATTVVEEGLDVSTVRCIIHLSPPSNPVAQTQRSGRARDGNNSKSVVLQDDDAVQVTSLHSVAALQTRVAEALSRTSGATLIPFEEARKAEQRRGYDFEAPTTAGGSSKGKKGSAAAAASAAPPQPPGKTSLVSGSDRQRFATMNPISAINELTQRQIIPPMVEKMQSIAVSRGVNHFRCVMSLQPLGLQVSAEQQASKQAARTLTATELLAKVLEMCCA